MGFLSATVTFTRYRVEGELSGNFWKSAVEKMESLKFRENGAGIENDSYGWVSVRDPYSATTNMDDIAYGNYLLAAIRVEQRSVPVAVIKKYCSIEEKRVLEEKDIKRLPTRVRKEIRDKVRFELLAKTIPVPRIVELLWDISSGQVLLFSCQERNREIAEDLFYRTFEIRLKPVIPYTIAEEFAESQGLEESLSSIRAEVLA